MIMGAGPANAVRGHRKGSRKYQHRNAVIRSFLLRALWPASGIKHSALSKRPRNCPYPSGVETTASANKQGLTMQENNVSYKISYYCSNNIGEKIHISSVSTYPDDKDYSEYISNLLCKRFADDPNFGNLTYSHEDSNHEKTTKELEEKTNTDILNSLIEKEKHNIVNRMQTVRKVCGIGHRIRAAVKINNKQPLSKAIIAINNEIIRRDILLNDTKQEYSSIISDELNVDNVIFAEGDLNQYFDYDLKPNFRSLGTKKLGKQANILKHSLANMSSLVKNELYIQLKNGGTRNLQILICFSKMLKQHLFQNQAMHRKLILLVRLFSTQN